MATQMRIPRYRAVCTAIVAVAILVNVSEAVVIAITTTLPSIEVRAPKGTPVRLSDFRGKVMLIKFWASWCPQCAETFAALDAIDREYRPKGVEVLAINVDEHRKNADAFLKGRAHQVRVLFDARLRAFEAFGAEGVPATYLIDRRGRIRHAHDDGDDSDAVYRAELDALLAEP
jgi:peroxiredoxin